MLYASEIHMRCVLIQKLVLEVGIFYNLTILEVGIFYNLTH